MFIARLITNLNNFSLELKQMISNSERYKIAEPQLDSCSPLQFGGMDAL